MEANQVRIGGQEHWTADGSRTLCGKLIAGTPVSPASSGFCEPCQQELPCDECGHGGAESHIWAPAVEERNPEAGRFVYDNATCWAEHICATCNPELARQALAMIERPAEADAYDLALGNPETYR